MSKDWRPDVPEANRIGFYGCGAGRGRLVRVEWRAERKPPRGVLDIECPCGNRHRVALTWRAPVDSDAGQEPDLVLRGDAEAVTS